MEETLRGTDFLTLFDETDVLILVLMEDTRRGPQTGRNTSHTCLNPCFNGIYSQRARHTNPLYRRDWYL